MIVVSADRRRTYNLPNLYSPYYKKKEPNMARACHVQSNELPGCCGVTVLSHMSRDRHLGIGTAVESGDSDALAKHLMGIIDPEEKGCYLYTTIQSQKAQYNALKMAGFEVIGKFKNPRTGNWVLIHAWMKAPLPRRTKTVRGPRVVGRVAAPRRTAAKRRVVRSR